MTNGVLPGDGLGLSHVAISKLSRLTGSFATGLHIFSTGLRSQRTSKTQGRYVGAGSLHCALRLSTTLHPQVIQQIWQTQMASSLR